MGPRLQPQHLRPQLQPRLQPQQLRPSRINPRLSAYNQVWGNFDFSRTPLAPPGCKVVVHESPDRRESDAAHGKIGYFTDMAREHHRCYKIYVPETGGMRIAATVEFFPK